jgi:hypothetical protein
LAENPLLCAIYPKLGDRFSTIAAVQLTLNNDLFETVRSLELLQAGAFINLLSFLNFSPFFIFTFGMS